MFVQSTEDERPRVLHLQIHDAISDHASGITLLNKTLWTDKSMALDQIAQNAASATHSDGLIKQVLTLLEKQMSENGATTAELRADVQAAVSSIAQHPTFALATGAPPPDAAELQAMRAKSEEIGKRSEHGIKALQTRINNIMRSAEALVESLRIEEDISSCPTWTQQWPTPRPCRVPRLMKQTHAS